MLDAVGGLIGWADGSVTSFAIADLGAGALGTKWLYQLFDGKCSATVADHCRTVSFDGHPPEFADGATPQHEIGTREALGNFIAALRGRYDPEASGLDGLRALAMVTAADRSIAADGGEVDLADVAPRGMTWI